jgi:carboxymethylenebutenolidase
MSNAGANEPNFVKQIEQMHSLEGIGGKLPVFMASPDDSLKHPAVIIIHEIFGLNDHIKDIARRFASLNITAFAPDLFAYASDLPEDKNDLNAMRTVWQNIDDKQLIKDLQIVFNFAKKSNCVLPDKIGSIGYCMGGAIALIFAASEPEIAWIADYYGRVQYPNLTEKKTKHPVDYIDTLKCPFLGIFAGIDELIPDTQIALLKERLSQKKIKSLVKQYPGVKHAFFNDRRENYDKDAANDAWKITLEFIAQANNLTLNAKS